MHRFVLFGAVLLCVCMLVACDPKPGTHDPGFVAKEWSLTLREYGIVPVFPPREDVQVGDVYALPVPPGADIQMKTVRDANGQFLPIGAHIASLDVRELLKDHYKTRISFPRTAGFTPSTAPADMAQPTDANGVFSTTDLSRPRLGGFPEFFSAQISQADADAVVPTEIASIALGASRSAKKRLRVSLPMVESYGLPAVRVMQLIGSEDGTISIGTQTEEDDAGDPVEITAEQLRALVKPAGGFDSKTQKLVDKELAREKAAGYLVLITEVYSTRAIDISAEVETGGAAGANVKPTAKLLEDLTGVPAATPADTAGKQGDGAAKGGDAKAGGAADAAAKAAEATAAAEANKDAATGESANAAAQPAAGAEDAGKTTTAKEAAKTVSAAEAGFARAEQAHSSQIEALNRQLAASAPGVNVRVMSVTASGVSMRRTYERPIVVGYRGIVYKVGEGDTLEVVGSATGNIPVSKVDPGFDAKREQIQTDLTAVAQRFANTATVGLTSSLDDDDQRTVNVIVRNARALSAEERTRLQNELVQAVKRHFADAEVNVRVMD
jgi:hypothetical protein